MLIRVEHATAYSYSEPLVSSTQYLRMTPLSGSTQAVESWKLSCPGATTTPWQDQYGNLCHTLTVAQPIDALEIKVCGLVRTRDTSGVVGTAPIELPAAIYLRETPYTVMAPSISAFAARFKPKLKRDAIATLHDIMMAIGEAVEYRKGETHVHTTGAEALEQGGGGLPGPRPYLLRRVPDARRAGPLCERLSDPGRRPRGACRQPWLGRGPGRGTRLGRVRSDQSRLCDRSVYSHRRRPRLW